MIQKIIETLNDYIDDLNDKLYVELDKDGKKFYTDRIKELKKLIKWLNKLGE